MSKLSYYDIKGKYNNLIKSYLSDRQQYVIDENSGLLTISCGIPQGSILGPLLFLLYVNDLHKASTTLNCIMFADDTNFFLAHKNVKQLFSMMNVELDKINNWLKANKLSLNTDKTKYTLFHKPSQTDDLPLNFPDLLIDSSKLEHTPHIKFLGIIIDNNLSWKFHIQNLETIIARVIGTMYKVRPMLNFSCLKSLYFSLIHSHLSYANIAWGSTHSTKLKKLISLQKHAIRIICNKRKFESIIPSMKLLKILNAEEINIHQHLLFMHKFRLGKLPNNFNPFFTLLANVGRYNLRSKQSNDFKLPPRKSKYSDFSISYRGPKIWNSSISNEFKSIKNFKSFKYLTKKSLLDLN